MHGADERAKNEYQGAADIERRRQRARVGVECLATDDLIGTTRQQARVDRRANDSVGGHQAGRDEQDNNSVGKPAGPPGQDGGEHDGRGQSRETYVEVVGYQRWYRCAKDADHRQRPEAWVGVEIHGARAQVGGDADCARHVPGPIQARAPTERAAEGLSSRRQRVPQQAEGPDQVIRLPPFEESC